MGEQARETKVIVIATDPSGGTVGFEARGWKAAHSLRQLIESYPNRSYGWEYVQTMRLISQREVR